MAKKKTIKLSVSIPMYHFLIDATFYATLCQKCNTLCIYVICALCTKYAQQCSKVWMYIYARKRGT